MISVTWKAYLIASFVLLGIYYAVIVFVYFRKKGKSSRARSDRKPAPVSQDNIAIEEPVANLSPQNLFSDDTNPVTVVETVSPGINMQALVDELQAFTAAAGEDSMTKEELQESIKRLLRKHPGIAGTELQSGISTLIAVTLENNCAVHLNAEEVNELWKG